MRIMPAGIGSRDFRPTSLVKTASSENGKEQYTDDLYEAAKKVVAGFGCDESCDGTGNGGFMSEETEETNNVKFEGEVEEVFEVADGEEGAVECLKKAKESIEDAVELLGGEDDDEFEAEVTFEDEDGDNEEVEVEVESGSCAKKEEVVGETNEEPSIEATASANDWVKVSAISPNNRKKLIDYWGNKLGYPKDFVKLMVKDYEK